jgi:hypothetical protein
MKNTLDQVEGVETIEVDSRFTRGTLPNQNPVLCELSLLNNTDSISDDVLRQRLVHMLRDSIKSHDYNADPKFNIVFLE